MSCLFTADFSKLVYFFFFFLSHDHTTYVGEPNFIKRKKKEKNTKLCEKIHNKTEVRENTIKLYFY
jgi:hypothetical protein